MHLDFVRRGLLAAILVTAGLVGCSAGGGDEDAAAVNAVATEASEGPIAGFGSVIVNGDRWRMTSAAVEVDGEPGSQADLAIGMVVRIDGDRARDGSKHARRVRYAPRLRGPIRAIEDLGEDARAIEIFGHRAIVSKTTTRIVGTTLGDMMLDDLVEVSGLPNADGDLEALFLRDRGDAVVGTSRVRTFGEVTGLAGGSFMLRTSEILFDADTEIEDVGADGLTDGDRVRVGGILLANDAIDAARIRGREDDDDVDEISIQGIVRDYVSVADFQIGDQPVDASGARFMPDDPMLLRDGVRVEAEGSLDDAGVLIATKLKFRSHRVRIHAQVADDLDVDPRIGEFTLLGITIHVPHDCRLRDQRDRRHGFSLDHVGAGDFLEVRGIVRPDGAVIALHVHRDEPDDIRLRGPVDGVDADARSIQILGIDVPTDGATEFEIDDAVVDAGTFFDRVEPGWAVHVRDREDGDETAIDVADDVDADAPELEDDESDERPDPDDAEGESTSD